MGAMGPLNTVGLLILGAALLWTVRLVYGAGGRFADDMMRRMLLVTGWLLILAGLLGMLMGLLSWLSILFWLALLVVAFMVLGKYQDSERQALLWTLAVAAEKDIPLATAVRAFANERQFSLGARPSQLASLLDQGVPLPRALYESRNSLPMDATLAVRFGSETGQLGPALRQTLLSSSVVDITIRSLIEKVFYLVLVATIGISVVLFFSIMIMPRFEMVMASFSVTLSTPTLMAVSFCNALASYWYLLTPILVLLPVLALICLLYYVGWLNHDLPLLGWLWRRYDSALLLRCLALAVRQQRALDKTLVMLSQQFPRSVVRRRLRRAVGQINNGQDWCHSLLRVGLLRRYEAAVLKSAERVGNLAWALDEMADSGVRRLALRFRTALGWIVPPLFVCFGLFVGVLTVGMFLPLVEMIEASS